MDLDDLVSRLAREGLVLRIDDGLAFARKNQVFLLRHEPSGTDVDLSLAWLVGTLERLVRTVRGSADGPRHVQKARKRRARRL